MYLHLGNETVIKTDDIVGIFDLESCTVSKHSRKYLKLVQDAKKVINVSYELPKSFIVCVKNEKEMVYISQISPKTLMKRLNFLKGKEIKQ